MVGILRGIDSDRRQDARKRSRNPEHPLHQLGGPELPYHAVAIKRGNDTDLPGDDVVKLHDIVYFTTTPQVRTIYPQDSRQRKIMPTYAMSHDYGWKPHHRAYRTISDYMQVKIVDNDLNHCNRLTRLLDDKTMIISGDGQDMDLLMKD